MTGKTILITGANSGIGYEAAVSLAADGAHIIMVSRDGARGQSALNALVSRVPNARVELAELDLGDLASICEYSSKFVASGRSLDILINNAGVMAPPRREETKDGFELQIGTNVIGHFALTMQLMPALKRAEALSQTPPRVVTVASIAHKRGHIAFDDLQSEIDYNPMKSYAQSKLANLIFAIELDRRLIQAGSQILSIGVHPGISKTNLFVAGKRSALDLGLRNLATLLIGIAFNSQAQGALPLIFAATEPNISGATYWGPQGLLETRGQRVGRAQIAPQAFDKTTAKRLWETLETLSKTRL